MSIDDSILALDERLRELESGNIIERFNYWEKTKQDTMDAAEFMRRTDAGINKNWNDFNMRLSKIEKFTTYLLDFFNPDHKLKKRIEQLEKDLEKKDKRIEEFEKKLKDLLNAN